MGYPKYVYDKAWNTLQLRRQTARDTAQARRAEIHQAVPEIRTLEREMAGTAAAVTKAVITSPQKADRLIAELGERNLALQERRRELLVQAGFRPDYLEEQHTCPHCRDSGYQGVEMCACFRELLRQEACKQLGGGIQDAPMDFHSFLLEMYPTQPVDKSGVIPRDRMRGVLEECVQYVEQFGRRAPSLLLQGPTGLGKTHLSMAVATQVTKRGFGVIYSSAQRLMDKLEAEKFSRDYDNREQYAESVQAVLDCDLLVLDDLGAEFANQFTNSALYNIINTRLLESRPTIINTNLTLAEIEGKYSPRIVSRLVCDYKVLRFFGRDIRHVRRMR